MNCYDQSDRRYYHFRSTLKRDDFFRVCLLFKLNGFVWLRHFSPMKCWRLCREIDGVLGAIQTCFVHVL